MEAHPLDHELYEKKNGVVPYEDWIAGLDPTTRARIRNRIDKLSEGILEPKKPIEGSKIMELIEDFGPGYRIYCRKIGKRKYLILTGGKKDTQKKDIRRAKSYLADYEKND